MLFTTAAIMDRCSSPNRYTAAAAAKLSADDKTLRGNGQADIRQGAIFRELDRLPDQRAEINCPAATDHGRVHPLSEHCRN